MDVLPWIACLPFAWSGGGQSPSKDSHLVLTLLSSGENSILLKAEYTAAKSEDAPASVTLAVCLQGPLKRGAATDDSALKPIWTSDPCPLPAAADSSNYYFARPLLLQLLQEVVARAPDHEGNGGACLLPLTVDDLQVDSLFDGSEVAASFFALVFLCRLFWLCACEATIVRPFDAGALFFQLLASNLPRALDCRRVMRDFFLATGSNLELAFTRAVGYMLAKWCILRDLTTAPCQAPPRPTYSVSYAADLHGLWVLRGYAPVPAMGSLSARGSGGRPAVASREPVLKYALAHQQLEAVVQLEYEVRPLNERFLQVCARVDNIRARVARLGFARAGATSPEDAGMEEPVAIERHFPSRVRVCAGPDPSSALSRRVAALSLGRSTGNPEREVEREQTLHGTFFAPKISKSPGSSPQLKAETRASMRTRARSWRWEQEAEGNTAVFEGVLCDTATGTEVAGWRGPGAGADPRAGMRRRCSGTGRAFGKSGGVVVAGDEIGEWVTWRVAREAEGQVLRWRLGTKVWVSYLPNEIRSEFFETRCVEWKEDIELNLVCHKGSI